MSDMAVADRYSRLILWLKIALPLVALAILSTLFFVAETLDPEAAIPYAKVDVERILREQGITRPSFGGVTESGVAIALTAESIRPDPDAEQKLKAADLAASLDLPDGSHIDVTSPEGIVDGVNQEAILQGGARLESSTGYVVQTDRIIASVRDGRIASDSKVTATGPAGEIHAGRMELTQQAGSDAGYLLVFSDGVRLIFRPGS